MPIFTTAPGRTLILLVLLGLGGCAADRHHRAGLSAMADGQYAEAIRELQQAAELEPRDTRFRADWLQQRETAVRQLLSRAETALAAGREAEAEQHYRAILSFDRDNARAKAGLVQLTRLAQAVDATGRARTALQQGDSEQAAQWLARALADNPNHAEAKALRREIETLQAKDLLSAPSLGAMYQKPINLEFRDASLKMVFEALSRTTGINFIFDREVRGDQRTTVFLKQTGLEDAIDVILTTNQLDKKILNAGSVLIYPNTGGKSREYQDLLVKAFYLANSEAKQTANLLKTVLKLKEVYVDDKLNMLILRETPDTIALAEKLIALQDLDEPEVMLEVEVLEVKRSRLLDLGVKLTDQLTVAPLTNNASNSTTNAASPSFKLSELRNLNASKLGITLPSATMTFHQEDGDAKLLANPRIRVRDREKAKILIGDKVPIVTTTSTSTGFNSENIQYMDVGLKLEVEPDVHLRDEIGLKVALEVSSLVGAVKTTNGSQAYQIGTRSANSVLRLKDGETQVLAGLISDEDRSSANRLPLLGDLPLLGRLFSSQKDDKQRTEIVLSITPRLIRNIQRQSPAAESFWSGTEASLRTKPLQLRNLETPVAVAKPLAAAEPAAKPSEAVPAPVGLRLSWQGPSQAKLGETIQLSLRLDSAEALRAAPMQLLFDPSRLEVVSVRLGDFFGTAPVSFSQLVDSASGRITVGLAGSGPDGVSGQGNLLLIELKPLQADLAAEISLVGMAPVGPRAAPVLPLHHPLAILP
ncbi:general secretion pathway protein GspD [Chitinimonas arctica]|uniref:General secretion pathway protein GspD n=1 Tax=Chitinimonas arctica TaxID=2594795 RepID=A0A516SCX5_9NEIS|nr:cohesin domain-containing protein [Chitinimonas arctica]QDQ26006.1 general secretion pathway protein GspD [Chitinimonas arctica]